MDADISTLYQSGFYQILNFKCRCTDCITSKPEYVNTFSISFVRKGNFLFNVFRNSFDAHTGRILLTKPGYEHTVTHIHDIPDECTIIEFTGEFYQKISEYYKQHRFFIDNDIHSLQIHTSADTEFLHYYLISKLLSKRTDRLELDLIIMEIVEKTLNVVIPTHSIILSPRMKKNHLITIEKAKEFMMMNFAQDISLSHIADACYISPFHFSRIFKTFTSSSPHSFLLTLRLKNAEFLLKTTTYPVTDIAFLSGFNSLDHFSATFTERFGQSPAKYRIQNQTHT
ncbi:Bifunctional transcriptional activator/DNA repair enzyme AdaA [compost metagenome]